MDIYDLVIYYIFCGTVTGFYELFRIIHVNKEIDKNKFGIKKIRNKIMNFAVILAGLLWPVYWIYSIIRAYEQTKSIKQLFPDMQISFWDLL